MLLRDFMTRPYSHNQVSSNLRVNDLHCETGKHESDVTKSDGANEVQHKKALSMGKSLVGWRDSITHFVRP